MPEPSLPMCTKCGFESADLIAGLCIVCAKDAAKARAAELHPPCEFCGTTQHVKLVKEVGTGDEINGCLNCLLKLSGAEDEERRVQEEIAGRL